MDELLPPNPTHPRGGFRPPLFGHAFCQNTPMRVQTLVAKLPAKFSAQQGYYFYWSIESLTAQHLGDLQLAFSSVFGAVLDFKPTAEQFTSIEKRATAEHYAHIMMRWREKTLSGEGLSFSVPLPRTSLPEHPSPCPPRAESPPVSLPPCRRRSDYRRPPCQRLLLRH